MPDAPTPTELHAILQRPLADLPDPLPIVPPTRPRGRPPADITVRPPGSKSLTNRALLLAALADGVTTLRRPLLEADDAERMLAAIETLGAKVERIPSSEPRASARAVPDDAPDLRITGVAGRWPVPPEGVTIDVAGAGTAARFLAAASLLATGPVTITGNARMKQRPIAELADALRSVGATVEHLESPDCPPVRITPPPGNIPTTAAVALGNTQSSQFISALLLVGGFLPSGLALRLALPITSESYVRMTLDLLASLECPARSAADLSVIQVSHAPRAFDLEIEPDASGATYFWAAGALLRDATVRVDGLAGESLQGDARFIDELERMGATIATRGTIVTCRAPDGLRSTMTSLHDMPDAAMTLAVCASFAPGTSIFRGVRTLRVKETDRIAALVNELAKVAVTVEPDLMGDPDAISITPPPRGIDVSQDAPRVEFDTYDDHRMAMSLALLGLRRPNVWIRDPACVAKTYPGYWQDLARLYE